MDIKQPTYFMAVAREGSYSKAAEKLGISQPTLSIAAKKLEEELGVKLFYTFVRCQKLTDGGRALLEQLHRQVVVLNRSVPGFLVNRFAQALFRESIYLIEQGVTTAADIDKAVKYAMGMRYASIGLLEYFDAVGFDPETAIAKNVYPDLCDTKDIQQLVLNGLASGKTGQAAGEGLYDWSVKDQDDFRLRKQSPYFDGVKAWAMPE